MSYQPTTLIAIDPTELQALRDEIAALRRSIEKVAMTPRPEWVTIAEFASLRGKSIKTIRNWINAGQLETKREGSVTLVHVA